MTNRACSALIALLTVCALGACTAWEYEIAECDPSVTILSADRCNELNSDPNDCMPYQCDRLTRHCVRAVRDFDHDGDPDSRCGGTDCADSDPKIKGGADGMCSCKMAGGTCQAGIGACKRSGELVCNDDKLVCPAMAASGMQDFQTTPYVGPSGYTSSDWNCDGKDELACCYLNENQTLICSACAQADASFCPGNVQDACTAYCGGFSDTNCPTTTVPKMYACSPGQCGASAAQCTCQVYNSGGLFPTKKCVLKNAIPERVRCR